MNALMVSLGKNYCYQSSGLPTYILLHLELHSVDGIGQIQTNKQDGYFIPTK
jgi:hypothetical protein